MARGKNKRKIGLFGGTFDPVHKGHLAVARGVLARYGLDELLFIPAPYPPHKNRQLTGFQHRVAMLETVLAGEPKIAISLIEAERPSPSYTLYTLLALREKLGDHSYYLLIGADSFVEVHLWYRYRELFHLTDLIVAARPGIDREEVVRQVGRLPGLFRYDRDGDAWIRDDGFRICYFSSIQVDLSSSEIRERLALNREVNDLLPPAVLEYIRKHHLYAGTG